MELNKVNAIIGGKSYPLLTADNPDYLYDITRQLDKRIKEFMENNKNASILTAAIMVSLDILDENNKTNSNIDNIRTQIKTYMDEAVKARRQASEASAKLKVAEEKIIKLKTEIGFNELKEITTNE